MSDAMGDVESRFWHKVKIGDGCWEWNAYRIKAGYGRFWNGETTKSAHRCAYEYAVGPIPEGLQVDHICRNRSCVRPSHLEAVTLSENQRRTRKITCDKGHWFIGYNVMFLKRRDGSAYRICRKCHNRHNRRKSDSYYRGVRA